MKILVVDHAGSFSLVPDLINATKDKHEILTMASVQNVQYRELFRNVDPDVVLCEWGDANAAALSNDPFMSRVPLIVRLHGYESHDWFVNRIEWNNVNALAVVSPYFQRLMIAKMQIRAMSPKVVCIPNGVDLDRFKIVSNHYEPNKVAWVGYLNMKKGPSLLRCVAESYPHLEIDAVGTFQCENTQRLLMEAPGNLKFYPWRDDVENFYNEHAWILSTSTTESFSYAVAEGMACGLTPMVFAWPGADELWPKECVWQSMNDLGTIKLKDPAECRKWVEERYSKAQQISRFVELIESI
jgi:glycosyltransferase involved in cell wall biosynthesis